MRFRSAVHPFPTLQSSFLVESMALGLEEDRDSPLLSTRVLVPFHRSGVAASLACHSAQREGAVLVRVEEREELPGRENRMVCFPLLFIGEVDTKIGRAHVRTPLPIPSSI